MLLDSYFLHFVTVGIRLQGLYPADSASRLWLILHGFHDLADSLGQRDPRSQTFTSRGVARSTNGKAFWRSVRRWSTIDRGLAQARLLNFGMPQWITLNEMMNRNWETGCDNSKRIQAGKPSLVAMGGSALFPPTIRERVLQTAESWC